MNEDGPTLNGASDRRVRKADTMDTNPSETDDAEDDKKWTMDSNSGREDVSHKSLFKANWHPTIVYCGLFWSFGMCVAFLGPTLLDLGCQTSSDMKKISWVFFAQLCCTMIGSMIAGYLASRSVNLSSFNTSSVYFSSF